MIMQSIHNDTVIFVRGAVLSIIMGMFTLATSLILYVKVRGIHKKTWKGTVWLPLLFQALFPLRRLELGVSGGMGSIFVVGCTGHSNHRS